MSRSAVTSRTQVGRSSVDNSAIVRRTFDFSAIHQSMADIKRSIWDSDRRQQIFKKQMTSQHSYFANKIILSKREEAFNCYSQSSIRFNNREGEVDPDQRSASAQLTRVKRDTAKEEIQLKSTQQAKNMLKMIYNSVKSKGNRYNRHFQEDGPGDRNRMEKLIIPYQDPYRNIGSESPVKLAQTSSSYNNRPSSSQQKPAFKELSKSPYIQESQIKPLNLMKMAPLKDTPEQKQNDPLQNLLQYKLELSLLAENQKRRKKEAIDKIVRKFHLEMNIHNLGSREPEQIPENQSRPSVMPQTFYLDPTKLNLSHKEWCKLLLHSDLKFLSNQQFKILLGIERIMTPIARDLQFIHGFDKFTREELEDTLIVSDKDLFINFRDKKISYDQLRARVAERQGIASYKVFDDIKDMLHPGLLQRLEKMKVRQERILAEKRKVAVAY